MEKETGKVIDLMDALRRSLAGKGGGSRDRVESKNGKAVAKATPKPKKRAV